MKLTNRVYAVPASFFNAADISEINYLPLNLDPLQEPCFLMRIINASTEDIWISYDGVTEHDYIPAGHTTTINYQTNALPNAYVAQEPKGLTVYVKDVIAPFKPLGSIVLAAYTQWREE
jgi:hypothetical protein